VGTISQPIKILIADDDRLVRRSLRLLLQREEDIAVVGEAADGLEAVSRTARACPDVVLMDAGMPRVDGIEATRMVKEICPKVKVIVLTVYGDRLLEALLAGASHYLLKDCAREELLVRIRESIHQRSAV